jgi:hypothetical protein
MLPDLEASRGAWPPTTALDCTAEANRVLRAQIRRTTTGLAGVVRSVQNAPAPAARATGCIRNVLVDLQR